MLCGMLLLHVMCIWCTYTKDETNITICICRSWLKSLAHIKLQSSLFSVIYVAWRWTRNTFDRQTDSLWLWCQGDVYYLVVLLLFLFNFFIMLYLILRPRVQLLHIKIFVIKKSSNAIEFQGSTPKWTMTTV